MTARTDYAFSTKTQDGYLTPNSECLIGHGAAAFGSTTPHHAMKAMKSERQRYIKLPSF